MNEMQELICDDIDFDSLKEIEDFDFDEFYSNWSPDGKYIDFMDSEDEEDNKKAVRFFRDFLLDEVMDRISKWNDIDVAKIAEGIRIQRIQFEVILDEVNGQINIDLNIYGNHILVTDILGCEVHLIEFIVAALFLMLEAKRDFEPTTTFDDLFCKCSHIYPMMK